MTSLIGRMIGKYRIEALVGDGGMGTVYRAYDTDLERPVALKLMHAHYARQPEFRARLRQEALTAAKLDHPSIVKIYDFGDSPEGAFITMEFIGGGSLRSHLQRLQARQRFLPLAQSLQIGAQIAEALDYAHLQGVIHRDVKPGNIILKKLTRPEEPNGQPFRAVLTDFGLVRLVSGDRITQSGMTLGTPIYMSPEQCQGHELDGRSDLYSLGVVLYELFTNRLPFDFKNLSEALNAHLNGIMPSLAQSIRPELPSLIDTLLQTALAKSPEERFHSGAEMADALMSAVMSLEGAATRVIRAGSPEDPLAQTVERVPAGYQLLIYTPGHDPGVADLNRPVMKIGRNADNDIVLPVEGVSRYHTRLQATATGWLVTDLGGINGTYLDGRRLTVNEPTAFKAGSRLQVGPYELVLQSSAAAAPPDPATVVSLNQITGVRPQTEQPTASPMPTAVSEPLAIFLAQDRLSVEPGQDVELQVEIVNRSERDDRINLRLQGLPDSWYTLPREFTTIPAGGTVPINVVIRPPRRGTTPAGRQRFRVELVSQQFPQAKIAANGSLDLGVFEAFEAALEPRQVRVPATVNVNIRNVGNTPLDLGVVGDDAHGSIRFRGQRGRVRLEPQQKTTVDLELEPRQQPWFGGAETYGYEVEVFSQSGARQRLPGQAQVSAILPSWVYTMMLLIIGFTCVLGALFALRELGLQLLDGSETLTPTVTLINTINITETSVSANATISAATAIALTITPGGDTDADGLSDAQELIVGSDPTRPDTDGDGLTDGEEALTYGSNPLNRDTDGDILPDGDEVKIYQTNPIRTDTDGDGIADGVEVTQGSDPRSTPLATATVTPLPTVTGTPPPTLTPSVTPLPSATFTPSWTPSATATNAPTATFTPPPSATPTLTPSPLPSATMTPSITPTPTSTPSALACIATPPVLTDPFSAANWGNTPMATFSLTGNPARLTNVYFVHNATYFYLAMVVADDTVTANDSLALYFDTDNNRGDPSAADRFFQFTRQPAGAIGRGLGSNSDGDFWESGYTSNEWQYQYELTETGWIIKMQVNTDTEMAALGSLFNMMVKVVFAGEDIASWPQNANSGDLATWQSVVNVNCP